MTTKAEQSEALAYLATLRTRLAAREVADILIADSAEVELGKVFKEQRLLDLLHLEADAQIDSAKKAAVALWRKSNVRGAPPASVFETDSEFQAAKKRRGAIYVSSPTLLTAQSAITILEMAIKAFDASTLA